MSILLPRYSGFPPEIFEMGLVRLMSDSALRLYFFLCRNSDKKTRLRFTATDGEIGEQTGASPRSLRDARINLKKLGLIACEKAAGGSYVYSLCNVSTGMPFPGDQSIKARYTKKEKAPKLEGPIPSRSDQVPPFIAVAVPSPVTVPVPVRVPCPLPVSALVRVAWDDKSAHDTVDYETSFPYGHNAEPRKVYFPLDAYDAPR